MYYPKFNQPFHISTDASDVGIGAIVYQIDQQDQIHPVYFYSKKLTNTKIKIMSIVEKEAFAIVCILEHLRSMLLGQQIKIYCDNRNVMYMENCKGLHKLQNISQKVSKIEGKDNSVADLLSRIYDNDSEQHNTIPLEVFAIDDFPLSYNYISIKQHQDPTLIKYIQVLQDPNTNANLTTKLRNKLQFLSIKIQNNNNLLYHKDQIFIPKSLVQEVHVGLTIFTNTLVK